jgi:hypothetical protein
MTGRDFLNCYPGRRSVMSTPPVVTPPAVRVEPDVFDLARRRGVEPVLQHMLEATPRLFPAGSVRVFIEPDVAIEDWFFLVFEVHVPPGSVPDRRAADRLWADELFRHYPYPRSQSFLLDLKVTQG